MGPVQGVKLLREIRNLLEVRYVTLFPALPFSLPSAVEEMSMASHTRPPMVGHWSEPALRVLHERYLSRDDGVVTETPEEMCWRVARAIAAAELRAGPRVAAVDQVAAAFYDMTVGGCALPPTPTPG